MELGGAVHMGEIAGEGLRRGDENTVNRDLRLPAARYNEATLFPATRFDKDTLKAERALLGDLAIWIQFRGSGYLNPKP